MLLSKHFGQSHPPFEDINIFLYLLKYSLK